MISRSGLLLLLVSASVPNVVSAKVRGGISNEQAIDHRDLVEIVAKIQQGYDELKSQHNELHSKHNKLQKQYDAEKAERELQQQLPRSACNCASLTVAGDTFLGGDTTIYGDANLSGDITTITGTSLSIQSKKTDIDGDMLTIQTSGAGTRTGANSAINVAGGVSSRRCLAVEILFFCILAVISLSQDISLIPLLPTHLHPLSHTGHYRGIAYRLRRNLPRWKHDCYGRRQSEWRPNNCRR